MFAILLKYFWKRFFLHFPQVHFAVPRCDTFAKFTPTVHLYMIFYESTKIMSCEL